MSFIITNETPCTCCAAHRAARIEHTSSGNVYWFKNEDVWVTCYGEQELADVISCNLGANGDEALELARQIDAIV